MSQTAIKEYIESQLGVELRSIYSSREDENPDEEYGHYEVYEAEPNPLAAVAEQVEPAVIKVYDCQAVQLYHDATPYPLSVHTVRQRRMMSQTQCEWPVNYASLTRRDWEDLVNGILEEYAD